LGFAKLKIITGKSKTFRKLARRRKYPVRTHRNGFTIVEAMIAATVTVIVALGTLCYQYHGVKQSRASQAQLVATRIGQLVLEDWKSTGGDPDYDSTELGLGFVDTTGSETGTCKITLDNQSFYLSLQQNNIDQDTVAGVKLCQIRVTVKWRVDYASGATSGSDPEINLTTYVRRDG
jgi:Tfp pilus assembly protein PilV